MNKTIKNLLILFAIIFVLIFPYFVFAQETIDPFANENNPLSRLKIVAEDSGPYGAVDENSLSEVAGLAASGFMVLLGVIFLILMLIGGYHWMTAQGDESKVESAQKTIRRAIIGLVLVAGSYAIYRFVFAVLNSA
ncbi:MAG: hypothetical protein ABH881_03510 [bacterium]